MTFLKSVNKMASKRFSGESEHDGLPDLLFSEKLNREKIYGSAFGNADITLFCINLYFFFLVIKHINHSESVYLHLFDVYSQQMWNKIYFYVP